jgi:hypothetical protein
MKGSPLFFLLVLAIPAAAGVARQASASQSNAPLGARLKMHWKNASITFREGAGEHEIALRDYSHAVRLDKVILQSAKEANGFIYLLLDVTGPSKLPRDSHQCGSGNESDLIWLKLDGNWKIIAEKDFQYDSCWKSVALIDAPKWQGDTLKVATVDKVATYSFNRPEQGLRVADDPTGK